ncbi:MAG: diaminopimelate epimerase [Candidatus Cloacimonadales bacterium]|nr:diaminopimelate epimerase [Candidatus Cloacimonadales bacterium]
MKLNFFKMHAQGNDYIYFDFLKSNPPDINYSKLSCILADRHFSIGGDGIVLIEKQNGFDGKMTIFNADGSEGKMCGSALRCVTSYLFQQTGKKDFLIETASGLKKCFVLNEAGDEVKVNLGTPFFKQENQLVVNGFPGYLVNIGNEHFVTFVDELPVEIARTAGPRIQNETLFPDGINVDFVRIRSRREAELRFWERGSGETLACGTGTGASVFAGIQLGFLDNKIDVIVPGGHIKAEFSGQDIFLSGKVSYVFSGSIEI